MQPKVSVAMNSSEVYDNPLVTRYASKDMARLWGPQRKFSTWRRLWLALAEAEKELGLLADDGVTPRITDAQLAELRTSPRRHRLRPRRLSRTRLRHDVMAHIHAYGDVAPARRDIIHLGATSCFVTDNTDLILMREGLGLAARPSRRRHRRPGAFRRQMARLGDARFHALSAGPADDGGQARLPVVLRSCSSICRNSNTASKPSASAARRARPERKRASWRCSAAITTRYAGSTNSSRKRWASSEVYAVTGQTYSRKVDSQILDALSGMGQSAHKLGTDLRLLAHRQEIDEPFEAEQVGSSAMAYKRNPMRAERMCGLARFVISLTANTAQTAATQWLERTLDDSVNRRLSLPQAFLGTDAVLRLALNICGGLVVNPDVIRRNVEHTLPYMLTENILMAAVAEGGDRQEIHECIRQHSQTVTAQLKAGGVKNDLFGDACAADPLLATLDFERVIAEGYLVGHA